MKKIVTVFVCLFFTGIVFSQPLNDSSKSTGKIILANGQKIVIESSTDMEASLTMGMELNGNTSSVNSLDVKNSTADEYTISHTLTKLKINIMMMGQANNYDSENKESNSSEMANIFDNKLNNPVDIVVDNKTGINVSEKKKRKKPDTNESNPAADMMNMFSNNSDEAIVSGAFEIIPAGKTVGDSWSDTTRTKDMKMMRTYTMKSVLGNEATVQVEIITSSVNKLDFQEMEFEIISETKTRGEIITDINTGLAKKRTTNSEISGSIQMMGQDMPISAKTNSVSIYK